MSRVSRVRSRSIRSNVEDALIRLQNASLIQPDEVDVLKTVFRTHTDAAAMQNMFEQCWTEYLEPSCVLPSGDAEEPVTSLASLDQRIQAHVEKDDEVKAWQECRTGLPNQIKRELIIYLIEHLKPPADLPDMSSITRFKEQRVKIFRSHSLVKETAKVNRRLLLEQSKIDELQEQSAATLDEMQKLTDQMNELRERKQALLESMSNASTPVVDNATMDWIREVVACTKQTANLGIKSLDSHTIALLGRLHTNLQQEMDHLQTERVTLQQNGRELNSVETRIFQTSDTFQMLDGLFRDYLEQE